MQFHFNGHPTSQSQKRIPLLRQIIKSKCPSLSIVICWAAAEVAVTTSSDVWQSDCWQFTSSAIRVASEVLPHDLVEIFPVSFHSFVLKKKQQTRKRLKRLLNFHITSRVKTWREPYGRGSVLVPMSPSPCWTEAAGRVWPVSSAVSDSNFQRSPCPPAKQSQWDILCDSAHRTPLRSILYFDSRAKCKVTHSDTSCTTPQNCM